MSRTCENCGNSGIEEYYAGHGTVKEIPCHMCQPSAQETDLPWQDGSAGRDGGDGVPVHSLSVQATNKPLQAEGAPAAEPVISTDGPHKISDHRKWLARQLLDSQLSDKEAIGIVAYSPGVYDLIRPQQPVAISREEIAQLIDPTMTEVGLKNFKPECTCTNCRRDSETFAKADAILARMGGRDQGSAVAGVCGEGTQPSPSVPPRSAGGVA